MMIIYTISVQMENPWRVHSASMEGTKKTDIPRELLTLVGASLRLNSRQTPWWGAGQPRPSVAWWCRAEGT